jgi:putative permease
MNDLQPIIINLNRRFVRLVGRTLLTLLCLTLIMFILPHTSMVLTPLILGAVMAFMLNPVVLFLESLGPSRTQATAIVMFVITLLFVLLVLLVAPFIVRELQTIREFVSHETPESMALKLKALLTTHLPFLNSPVLARQVMPRLERFVYYLFNRGLALLPNLFSALIITLLIPFMTFFLLKDGRRMKRAFLRAMPNRYFEMSVNLLHKIDNQLGRYLRGQILVSLCVGSLAILALILLDVPYAFIIGIAAGLANMIPYFGPIVGAVPAIILSYASRGTLSAVFEVVVAFALIRMADDFIITPNILGRSVHLHPILVVMVIFIGGEMAGILGLLLCIPVTGAIQVTIRELAWSLKHYRFSSGSGS